jgi:transcription-repair coupling factor (superfamily II helicase)
MIMEMGFEMYQRIVEEAVRELKEEEFEDLVETKKSELQKSVAGGMVPAGESIIETDIEALIPDIYIESDAERLDIYRRLYKTMSFEEIVALRTELKDRFGEYPKEVENLFHMIEIKILSSKIGFARIELINAQITFTLPPPENTSFFESPDTEISPFQFIMNFAADNKLYRLHLKQEGKALKLLGVLDKHSDDQNRIQSTIQLLQKLSPRVAGTTGSAS